MRPASHWREAPYPGERPGTSFVQVDDVVLTLEDGPGGASVDGTDLDTWLRARGEVPMAERVPLLAYGSNACPSKLMTMRHRDGLRGAVVLTACTVEGVAAAWCLGRRGEGSVVATLVDAPGTEAHFLWWIAPDQRDALDRCEGVAARVYQQRPVTAAVRHSDGTIVPGVHAYIGIAASRQPRRRPDGSPVLVRDLAPEIVQSPEFA